LILFYIHGIVTVNEASKYIEQADLLIESGNLSHPSMWLYSTEILLITAAKKLGTGYLSVVVFQLLLNGLATYFLYRLCNKLSDQFTATILVLFFILNYPFQTFNTTLYTESVFYSLITLLTCYLLQLKILTVRSLVFLLLFLLLICFTRPSGLLLVPCVFIYLFTNFFKQYSFIVKTSLVLGITLLFLFILNLAIGAGGQLDFMLPFKEEHIICGVPTITGNSFEPEPNSIFGIFSYIFQHPGQFFRLAVNRSIAFFGLTRNYYSNAHNLYLVLYFFPIYILALFSISTWWKINKGLLLYCLSFVLITWGTVILTCDDWHNRFFLSTMPLIYILSIPGLKFLLTKFSKK
jgi:hypothetical protein